jgi:hypothetical protein
LKGHHDLGLIKKPYLQKMYRMVRHFILPYRFTPSTIPDFKHLRHEQIKANFFTMGSEEFVVEQPEHKVYLNSYYLGIYEVTQQKFENIMG